MSDRDQFCQDVGLIGEFADALERWRTGNVERSRPRTRPVLAEPKAVADLRQRWSRAQARWWNHETPIAEKLKRDLAELLRVLSPTWSPPHEPEIEASTEPVRASLAAIESTINAIDASERSYNGGQRPWYFDTVELPGFDPNINHALGPGMAMLTPSGEDDPKLPLLACRDLLKTYLDRTTTKWLPTSIDGVPFRRALYEGVVVTLRRARVATRVIGLVLEAKGFTTEETTDLRINSTIDKLRSRHSITLPSLAQGRRPT